MSYERRSLGGIAQRSGDRLWYDQAADQDYVRHRVINGHVSRSRDFAGRVVA